MLDPNSLLPSARYLASFDNLGEPKVLQPSTPGLLGTDGTDIYWIDGTVDHPLVLPAMLSRSDNASGVVAQFPDGQVALVSGSGTSDLFLRYRNGAIHFTSLGVVGIPSSSSGYGFAIRAKYDADTQAAPPMGFIGGVAAIPILDIDGSPSFLPNGTNNYVLTMQNNEPTWLPPATGSIAAGGASVGFSGVVGNNTSSSVVNVKAPSMTLANLSGTEIKVVNVNVSASLASALGPGGLDVGSENSSQWYYIYIVSDNLGGVNAVISIDGNNPTMTNMGAYTYFALAGTFRNNASGNIVDFIQRGRDFWFAPIPIADPANITTSYTAVVSANIAQVISPIAKTISGVTGGSQASSEGAVVYTAVASTNTGIGSRTIPNNASSATANFEGFTAQWGPFDRLPIADPSSPTIYWKGHVASAKRRMVIHSYSI